MPAAPTAKRVFLDHNATTPIRPEVLEAMLPYLQSKFGNPNSSYSIGQETRKAVEQARSQVAKLLNASNEEIIFTSCGSESDVLAIAGAAWTARQGSDQKRQIITSAIEHDAIIIAADELKGQGFEPVFVGVDSKGRVDPAAVRKLLGPSTAVVSIMHANNEVGTTQPIAEIASVCREKGIPFHTDAVQSVGKVPVDVKALGVDLLSLSGHKVNAPKGVGALFVRKGMKLVPMITGHQEKNRRGGTENVASIVALGRACELAAKELKEESAKLLALRRKIEGGCLKIGGVRVNGHPEQRLPGTCHLSFEELDGSDLVIALDLEGICVSSGAACSAGITDSHSHVLEAMGVPAELLPGSLRVSVGWGSTDADVERFLSVLPKAVEKLRSARRAYSA